MSLLERLHALRDRIATREDKDLSELVQILIDGFAESEVVIEEKAAEVGAGSQGLLKMEAASEEHGGEA